MKYYLAIDIGERAVRHVIGYEKDGKIVTDEVHSFENTLAFDDGLFSFSIDALYEEIIIGISEAFSKYPEIESIAFNAHGTDYVLMSDSEEILPAYVYRDEDVCEIAPEVHELVSPKTVYEHTGIPFTTKNTLYKLYCDKVSLRLEDATDFLTLPEYLAFKLTGVKLKEYTSSVTTGLVNMDTFRYDRKIWSLLGLPISLDAKISMPGATVGKLKGDVAKRVGGDTCVILVASRSTASAIDGVEMEGDTPYILAGTDSVIGIKTPSPIIDEKSFDSRFSNEACVDYNAYQKTVTGAWIIGKLREEICPDFSDYDVVSAAKGSGYFEIFDVEGEKIRFGESVKAKIDDQMAKNGKQPPVTVGDYLKCAYASMAHCYGVSIAELEHNTGKAFGKIYVIENGSGDSYLKSLTEKYTGKRVITLETDAVVLGNIKAQMKRKGN